MVGGQSTSHSSKTMALYNDTAMPSFASIYNHESPKTNTAASSLSVENPRRYFYQLVIQQISLQTWELRRYTFDTITKIAKRFCKRNTKIRHRFAAYCVQHCNLRRCLVPNMLNTQLSLRTLRSNRNQLLAMRPAGQSGT